MTQKELDQLQEKALAQLKSGESLFGKEGAFAPMLQGFIQAALEAEMDAHLDADERKNGNKCHQKDLKL